MGHGGAPGRLAVKGQPAVAAQPLTASARAPGERHQTRSEAHMAPFQALPTQAAPHRLDVHTVSIQAAVSVLPVLRAAPSPFRVLADQATRALTSTALNAAEGYGRAGRDRLNHFHIAYGSAREASAALELLVAVQAIPAPPAEVALSMLDRTRAMLWRLIHPRG
jgi:four helix bundle protein